MKHLPLMSSLMAVLVLGTACAEESETKAEAPAAEPVATQAAAVVPAPATEQMHSEAPAAEQKPFVVFTEVDEVTATVIAINHETREVTLAGESGELSFVVGEEVRNLDQVNAGDTVVAEYMDQLSIEIVDGEGLEAEDAFVELAARAKEGDLPGIVTESVEVHVFMVEAIDMEDNTFKLRNADGVVRQFTAQNPENLKSANVGDALIATHSTAMAVGVVHAEQE
ncbi:hypothetical protein QWI17_02895 [Gilvimarinus sp. SDUM040013]|uniref:DUF5666 domain-containing protein n=1 Tax=Gilvimarinus gilvus TaxID=3058038 RepID=A0ABU4S1N1_9GAMM|nr:hypothetical protein [Gilvimarinus sp. SDUM040013]MDO3384781.1 hypothetical protein [Gilvimarinus sp. SDUM040013]MDX6850401.1 hypothetical protein [Gilvimarinus sp. SDUM040013]